MNKLRSLVFAAFLALPLASFAQVEFSVGWAPPPLPVYEQPACPVAGYIWTPGYWGWNADYYDYYWVPGVWVPPPRVGLLWTPGWWGWNNGAYAFNQGYWGPHVGFYGGVNYGYGYTGNGYWGGRWSGNTFQYNTAVTRVNKTVINNTYVNNSFQKNVNANRTSFNGGNGGIKTQPNAEQRAAMANAKKEGPTSQQLERQKLASKDKNFLASTNKGKPSQDAIRSLDRSEGAGQGGKQLEAQDKLGNHNIQGAGAGQSRNELDGALKEREHADKLGNTPEHNRQGAGAEGQGMAGGKGKGPGEEGQGMAGGKGKGPGEGAGGEEHGKKGGGNIHGNNQDVVGNQVGKHKKGVEHGGAGNGQNAMNQQQMRRQQQMNAQHHQQQMMGMGGGQHMQKQMGARNAQMGGGKHPQMQGGGNRQPKGQPQQQGKKKPNER